MSQCFAGSTHVYDAYLSGTPGTNASGRTSGVNCDCKSKF